MKKLLIVLLALPLIGFGQQNIITKVAKKELNNYLQKIPVGQENMFGFNNREEFSQAEIGDPYEIYTLNTEFFDAKNIISNKTYIVSTENWRVPIIVNNKYRVLLTISKVNNEWNVVEIGAKGLAEELDMFNKNHHTINELKILRVFQLKGDFIVTSENIIYPLASACNGLFIDNRSNKGYSIYEILTLIKNNEK
ncbi:MAG: hypothetical protein O3C42_00980 [Bacteroidetes bacterium]|nr:hypothetical protein [Bacteroidota bacterium]